MSFGSWLREAREARSINQTELGQVVGKSTATISAWERDARAPDLNEIFQICEALGCSSYAFFESLGKPFGDGLVWTEKAPHYDVEWEQQRALAGIEAFRMIINGGQWPEVQQYFSRERNIPHIANAIVDALRARFVELTQVPRDEGLEKELREALGVVARVADVPAELPGFLLDECLAFLVAHSVLPGLMAAHRAVGVSAGYPLLRAAELTVPLHCLSGTVWVPLAAFLNEGQALGDSPNQIATLFSSKQYNSTVITTYYREEDRRLAQSPISTTVHDREYRYMDTTTMFITADLRWEQLLYKDSFLSNPRLSQRATPETAAIVLGRPLDATGREINYSGNRDRESSSPLEEGVISVPLVDVRKASTRGNVWLVGNKDRKEAVAVTFESGLANRLVIDRETAEFVLSARKSSKKR